jgi:acetylornithine deacetylase/succinyl-diaminopimelate desuccinylase-like protein
MFLLLYCVMDNVLNYIETNRANFVDQLKELLRFPSISTNPENKEDVRKCAEYIKSQLESMGMLHAAVYPTAGHPVVYADWLHAGAGKPTVLIYGHYDVQPVDPLNLWTTPPFQPEIRNGKIFARGAVDDKGQVFIHLKSLEAHFKQNKSLPVNIKLIIEGEEEIGSMHLEDFIKKNKELLKSDVVVISDTAMFDKNTPAITYGLRGLCYMQVEVTGPNRDLHSGSFGGSIENPINALANMITKLKNDKGKILIDGFYDDVIPLTEREREEYRKLPFDDKAYKEDLRVSELSGEEGYTTIERIWARPTLDCNGIWGGFTGEGAKTVLPSKAFAKISMRLVPNQDPQKVEELFVRYIKKITPKTVKSETKGLHHGKPAITPIDSPWVRAAFKALKQGFKKEPVFIREGGSIPVVVSFKELLNLQTVLLGFGLHDENAHSPDEHFDLDNFHKGIITTSLFYDELGKLTK